MKIQETSKQYSGRLDRLDLELIIAYVLKNPREFVLAHPEKTVSKSQESEIRNLINRRIKHEPLAYILGEKEFYGLSFKVDKNTLIPRPETELLVEETLKEIQDAKYKMQNTIIDIGTGSGNIIIAIAKNFKFQISNFKFIGTDISEKALKIARQNAKLNKVENRIKFLHGDTLAPFIGNWKLEIDNCKLIIVANLPYLSQKIYNSASKDVKNFEPKTALFSQDEGLSHYKKLLEQTKKIVTSYELRVTIFLEISPEQKVQLNEFIKNLFPKSKPEFKKDLAGKWRICRIEL